MSIVISNDSFANIYDPKVEEEPKDTSRYTKKEIKEYLSEVRHKDKLPKIITYTKEEGQKVQEKIEKLSSNKHNYKTSLTKREKQIRVEILRKLYPIDWYVDMFDMIRFDKGDCNGPGFYRYDFRCNHAKALHKISEEEVISILLHYDILPRFYKNIDGELSQTDNIDVILYNIIIFGMMGHYISEIKFDSKGNFVYYSKNIATVKELTHLIKSKIILTNFLEKSKIAVGKKVDYLLKLNN